MALIDRPGCVFLTHLGLPTEASNRTSRMVTTAPFGEVKGSIEDDLPGA
jgi:hypothetical protein